VALLRLNRPEKLNAITHGPNSIDACLVKCLDQANADDEIGCIVLTGAGRAFSAGGDMSHQGLPRETVLDWHRYHETRDIALEALRGSSKPVIGAINGYCLGGGLIVAAHCDFLVAADDARFGMIEARMGASGIDIFPFLVGAQWAKFMMLTGETFSAQQALDMGLVLKVVPAASLVERVLELAQRVASLPPDGLYFNKRVVNAALEVMGWTAHKRAAYALGAMADFYKTGSRLGDGRSLFEILEKEGAKAFLEARDARFKRPWLDD
jgi:enoyl-CoA hydratase/carnithine racemase